jgi:hypothetical protein
MHENVLKIRDARLERIVTTKAFSELADVLPEIE